MTHHETDTHVLLYETGIFYGRMGKDLLLFLQHLLCWRGHEAMQHAGQHSASMARPVSLASVDLSTTIAGGDLMRSNSLPPSPGPFGSLSEAAPAFGAPSRARPSSPRKVSLAHD